MIENYFTKHYFAILFIFSQHVNTEVKRSNTYTLVFLNRPAITFKFFGFVCAVEKAALKELHSHNSEDEHEEHVDYQDVQYVLQRVHHTVKHGLRGTKERSYE